MGWLGKVLGFAVEGAEIVTDPVVNAGAKAVGWVGSAVGGFVINVVAGGIVGSGSALATIAGAFEWLSDNVGMIPNVGGVSGLLASFFGGIAGGLGFLADVIRAIHEILLFLDSRSGAQLVAVMVGIGLMIAGSYYIFSMILTGQLIAAPAFLSPIFFSAMGLWFGMALVIYSMDPVFGGGTIAGSGVVLAMMGQGAGEEEFIISGLIGTLVGMPMVTTAIGTSSVVTMMAFGGVLAAIYSTDQIREVA